MADERKKPADPFKEMFSVWEKNTSAYFEQLLRSPAFLEQMGSAMENSLALKQQLDEAARRTVETMQVATHADQQRLLREVGALHEEVAGLSQNVERLARSVADLASLVARSQAAERSESAAPPRQPRKARKARTTEEGEA